MDIRMFEETKDEIMARLKNSNANKNIVSNLNPINLPKEEILANIFEEVKSIRKMIEVKE